MGHYWGELAYPDDLPKPAPDLLKPFTPPTEGYLSNHMKEFCEKMSGHIRRELLYRRFAWHILTQLPALEANMTAESGRKLREAIVAWEKELDAIANK